MLSNRYGWHFPELAKIVNDNYQFARICLLVQDKAQLTDDKAPLLEEVTKDEAKAKEIIEAAKTSMGQVRSFACHHRYMNYHEHKIKRT